jgi:flagellin-specific chaperone FliS
MRTAPHLSTLQPRAVTPARAAAIGFNLLLLDEAIAALALVGAQRGARAGLAKDPLLGCIEIVVAFRSSLDLCAGGPQTVNLDDLCEYMTRKLRTLLRTEPADDRMISCPAASIEEVLGLLQEIRAAWGTLAHV